MTIHDVLADMFQGLGIPATPQRIAFYAQVIGEAAPNVSPDQLSIACRAAVRDSQRASPSPRDVLSALAKEAPAVSSESNREERRDTFRRVLEACEDATNGDWPHINDTPLARRVAWCELQARKPGMWGEMARMLLDRERRALDSARQQDADRARAQQGADAWSDRLRNEPPPIEAA